MQSSTHTVDLTQPFPFSENAELAQQQMAYLAARADTFLSSVGLANNTVYDQDGDLHPEYYERIQILSDIIGTGIKALGLQDDPFWSGYQGHFTDEPGLQLEYQGRLIGITFLDLGEQG